MDFNVDFWRAGPAALLRGLGFDQVPGTVPLIMGHPLDPYRGIPMTSTVAKNVNDSETPIVHGYPH